MKLKNNGEDRVLRVYILSSTEAFHNGIGLHLIDVLIKGTLWERPQTLFTLHKLIAISYC